MKFVGSIYYLDQNFILFHMKYLGKAKRKFVSYGF